MKGVNKGLKVDNQPKKVSTLSEIQRLQRERDERRRLMNEAKQERNIEEQKNRENGTPGDVDFQRMIRQYRENLSKEQAHLPPDDMKICICVRKRPISNKEIKKFDYDSVTCLNPTVVVHDCKFKVDGISKYLENTSFEMDHTFHEDSTTDDIYYYTVKPLVPFALKGGRATVFAYGQTGSGKTYTMQGIQTLLAEDLFQLLSESSYHENTQVVVSYFEIYGGRCQDLLNNRERLNVREDGNGEVVVSELLELSANNLDELQSIITTGNRNRTTHATESNDESSRSHAICLILLRDGNTSKLLGKISLIDLAGSERGADTKSHNRQRRMEGAEINKSLLALKECIRALDGNSQHVPYRASKLTLVLKDSFTRSQAKTVMIATVSPAASSADHTLNTLRYADRVKERTVGGQAAKNALVNNNNQVIDKSPINKINADKEKNNQLHQIEEEEAIDEFHRTVQDIFEQEEELLNLHMNIIQENAELLTEEGRLLQQIQSEDSDIDNYAMRLDSILQRKEELILLLKNKLVNFRKSLVKEEISSKRVAGNVRVY
mmetsp:Transcript_9728/g.8692  ORF Transcript_9728/g.8692 Transcript_9728/m.8692 type:complete len:550 (-) Transcript_9728:141-1790(-)